MLNIVHLIITQKQRETNGIMPVARGKKGEKKMDGYDLYKQAFEGYRGADVLDPVESRFKLEGMLLLLRSMCIITHDTWEMELDSVKAVFTPAGKEGGFLVETY